MKRILCLILVLLLMFPVASVSAEIIRMDANQTYDLEKYRLYDREIYEAPCDHPGRVVKLEYESRVYGRTYVHYLNVYLPYGYDENGTERYPILYFLHGNDGSQQTLLGDPVTVNVFDHMIESGEMPPCIIAAPSYFFHNQVGLVNVDEKLFEREMREEILPVVESTYRTYAETPDEAGFTASRNLRAVCGYSRGSLITWRLMRVMVDYARTFLPFSRVDEELVMNAVNAAMAGQYADDWFVYMASGDDLDAAGPACRNMALQLRRDARIRFGQDFAHDNFFYLASENPHQDQYTRCYLYNAFLDGLFREEKEN